VALIDHQGQMLFGTSNFDRQGIINNTVAFGKAARVFDVPVVFDNSRDEVLQREHVAAVASRIPGQEPIERSSMNSWDDKKLCRRDRKKRTQEDFSLPAFGRKPALRCRRCRRFMTATKSTLWRIAAADVSQLAHDNAMKRVIQAGAKPVTSLSVMLEWQRDWAHKETYDAVMDIVKNHYGAYGIGVEYVYHDGARLRRPRNSRSTRFPLQSQFTSKPDGRPPPPFLIHLENLKGRLPCLLAHIAQRQDRHERGALVC